MHDTWNIARMKKTFKYKFWKKKEMKNLIEFLYLKTLKCDIFLDITCIKMYVTEFTFKIFTFCSIRWINYITIISRFAKFDVYCKPIVKTWSWALIESLQYERRVLDKKRCYKLMHVVWCQNQSFPLLCLSLLCYMTFEPDLSLSERIQRLVQSRCKTLGL